MLAIFPLVLVTLWYTPSRPLISGAHPYGGWLGACIFQNGGCLLPLGPQGGLLVDWLAFGPSMIPFVVLCFLCICHLPPLLLKFGHLVVSDVDCKAYRIGGHGFDSYLMYCFEHRAQGCMAHPRYDSF